MGTTNILDLNNRLTKVEKGNVAQNSYTSLKNKPKINSVTLTGNKSLADIGAADAADLGDLTQLTTANKTSAVAAINEVNEGLSDLASLKGNKLITQLFQANGVLVNPGLTSDYSYDVTMAGYTPLGIIGAYIGGGQTTSLVSVRLNSATTGTVRILNSGSTAITPIDVAIIVLYVQNDPT